jgi:hypothetical protein
VRPSKAMLKRSAIALSGVVLTIVMASCSSGPATHAATSTSVTRSTASTSATTATTATSSPASATQTAILNAWQSAEQTLYAYLQGPWQQDRADLVGGETSADLWPKLANYFTNPALQSEDEFLVGVKMGQLNGPTTYNLGRPVVTAITPTSATVTGCIYDSGTTTASGKAGPATLDGGGAGGYMGTWNLQLVNGSWKIVSFKTSSVSKC